MAEEGPICDLCREPAASHVVSARSGSTVCLHCAGDILGCILKSPDASRQIEAFAKRTAAEALLRGTASRVMDALFSGTGRRG